LAEVSEFERLEEEVVDTVRGVLSEYEPQLRTLGLECVVHPLRRTSDGALNYTSEVVIDFRDSKGIVDVLEFHVVREGRPVVTRGELKARLREEVESIGRAQ